MPIAAESLAEVFVEVADTLVDEFDLIEFLQGLTRHSSALVHATGAGLLLADHHGGLRLMAASNENARMLELLQVQSDEGPCQDCFHQGTAVVNADLSEAAERWPTFAPRAVELGFRSVHAFPLRLRREVIGALNLFGAEATMMSEADVRVVQALADVATIGLLQERAIRKAEVLTEQLQLALNSRIVIEQAKGALAQVNLTTPDLAFELMRGWARSHGRRLGEVAQGVLTNPEDYPGLATLPLDGERRDT